MSAAYLFSQQRGPAIPRCPVHPGASFNRCRSSALRGIIVAHSCAASAIAMRAGHLRASLCASLLAINIPAHSLRKIVADGIYFATFSLSRSLSSPLRNYYVVVSKLLTSILYSLNFLEWNLIFLVKNLNIHENTANWVERNFTFQKCEIVYSSFEFIQINFKKSDFSRREDVL